jgi:hypothetical protein
MYVWPAQLDVPLAARNVGSPDVWREVRAHLRWNVDFLELRRIWLHRYDHEDPAMHSIGEPVRSVIGCNSVTLIARSAVFSQHLGSMTVFSSHNRQMHT